MAPRVKVIRRLGVRLPGLTRKSADRRPYPPGAHGPASHRRRKSDYRRQLEEKQKVRFHYGVSETQLRRSIAATAEDDGGGRSRLEVLERRLDNVVFRLGWAPTIPAARQLVAHGHVRVNRRRVDRPGYTVKVGDELRLSARARRIPEVVEALERGPEVFPPSYLDTGSESVAARVTGQPSRADIPFEVDEMAVIEFYAR
jgi:small subunit ribosomal protein S4